MSTNSSALNTVLFAGGRGSTSISSALAMNQEVALTIVLNAYDDGKSTGRIRREFPGMLGPSDIRKNFSNLLKTQNVDSHVIPEILEHRIGSVSSLIDPYGPRIDAEVLGHIESKTAQIPRNQGDKILAWAEIALAELRGIQTRQRDFYDDMAIGNLVFAGSYIEARCDFNSAIEMWNRLFNLRKVEIINITQGENRFLVAIKEDGTLLPNEEAIVSNQSTVPIRDLFLLSDELSSGDQDELKKRSLEDSVEFLKERERLPKVNPAALAAINSADIIVFGPGTQHSSLFPSYMTLGVGDAISQRNEIERVFIGNVEADHDIQGETLRSLLYKFGSFMNKGSTVARDPSSYVTQCFMSTSRESIRPWGLEEGFSSRVAIGVHTGQWTIDGKTHDGNRVASGLILLSNRLQELSTAVGYISISVVIPVLDEVDRISHVLEGLLKFDWLAHDLIPEFVVVDGGSVDGSLEIVKNFPVVHKISLVRGVGRGEAIRKGIESATGEFVVTFPADGEYEVGSIVEIIRVLRNSPVPVVFGSRAGFCVDSAKQLREIYGGRSFLYFASRWGGILLSLISGLLYKRWVADTLTSVKGFSRKALDSLSLAGVSADWDLQLIVDSSIHELAIAEIPVQYRPRTVKEGKKIRVIHGLRAILVLIKGLSLR